MINDTIAAISSGLTESGIGIIRISGSQSYEVIDRIFRTKKGNHVDLSEPNKVHYGFIVTCSGANNNSSSDKTTIDKNVSRETLDEVLVINMKAPHTYTGEDTIEIDCHGGVLMMKRILEAVTDAGARPAEPGEFTKRAFLNGRIDLSQAEAVIDLITAKNDNAIKASVSQLRGSVSDKIKEIRAKIINDTAFIEAALDDPENYSLDGFADTLRCNVEAVKNEIQDLIKSYKRGKLIREGINTVILGRPNAGKSSLLNAVLGEERAIVTKIPGTTRDTISESVSIGNVTLNLMDTAGIRRTEDEVEKIGIDRALKSAENADLILCVVDMSEALTDEDRELFKLVGEYNAKPLIIFNKSDLAQVVDINEAVSLLPKDKRSYIVISAKNEYGIDELYNYIDSMFTSGEIDYNDQLVISSVRHVALLKSAHASLSGVIESIDNNMPEDMYTIDLMDAYRALGEICGEEVGEDLINEIFSKFCMGK
ncbi:MAG: tRNA uridine-5-carboxymethylaminomethyl(34) synthesis GTPase MnmE [Lachnospiraceae bacterium]|nr:tRNA uridine-5-carboxymethylaminomethyl(34) synthesis GTPase MnmE [Lachnospiraceae bacterium]